MMQRYDFLLKKKWNWLNKIYGISQIIVILPVNKGKRIQIIRKNIK